MGEVSIDEILERELAIVIKQLEHRRNVGGYCKREERTVGMPG
jgi:hypothetical protein